MIKVNNLNLKFGDETIFQDANITIPDNKITMIVGPNGTGKTTLLKVITGQIKADCKIENTFKEIFYLPQKLNYTKGMTTFDYVSSALYKNNWKWFLNSSEKQRVNDILQKIDLGHRANINIEDLSAGEIQKANIALGMLSDADIFLLDEPTSNMDLVNQIKILDMIKKLTKSNITSVIIMHDLNLSSSYGDYFIGISKEHDIYTSEKQEFFKPEVLNKIYNITFKVVNNEEKFYVQIFN